MTVSVIVPTKDRLADLVETLASVCAAASPPDEVVVVDQTATSIEREVRGALGKETSGVEIRFLHRTDVEGVLHARDVGYRLSRGDVVLFLDDDITVYPDFFLEMRRVYADPEIDGVGAVDVLTARLPLWRIVGRLVFSTGPFWDNRSLVYKLHARLRHPVQTATFHGGFMSCRRVVYDRTGLDLSLTGHVFAGDIDFSFRAARHFSLVIAPTVRVLHRGGYSALYDSAEGERKRLHARLYFFDKNVNKTLRAYLALWWLVFGMLLASAIRAYELRNWGPIYGILRAWRMRAAQRPL